MQQRKHSRARHREERHRFGKTVDGCAPLLMQQKQNCGDQRSGVADSDPPHEIDDRESPANRNLDAPDAHALDEQVGDSQLNIISSASAIAKPTIQPFVVPRPSTIELILSVTVASVWPGSRTGASPAPAKFCEPSGSTRATPLLDLCKMPAKLHKGASKGLVKSSSRLFTTSRACQELLHSTRSEAQRSASSLFRSIAATAGGSLGRNRIRPKATSKQHQTRELSGDRLRRFYTFLQSIPDAQLLRAAKYGIVADQSRFAYGADFATNRNRILASVCHHYSQAFHLSARVSLRTAEPAP